MQWPNILVGGADIDLGSSFDSLTSVGEHGFPVPLVTQRGHRTGYVRMLLLISIFACPIALSWQVIRTPSQTVGNPSTLHTHSFEAARREHRRGCDQLAQRLPPFFAYLPIRVASAITRPLIAAATALRLDWGVNSSVVSSAYNLK